MVKVQNFDGFGGCKPMPVHQ